MSHDQGLGYSHLSTSLPAEATTFGQWLRRRRRALDLTQEALAACAGCAVPTIRKFEADERRPSRQLAELLADCLVIEDEARDQFVAFARRSAQQAGAPGQAPAAAHPADTPLASLIPVPLTSFIGRDDALDELMRAVRDDQARPLTLTGAGGSGKTRLALEVALDAAAELGDVLPHGVYWVDLAALDDGTRIAAAVAHALGLLEAVEQAAEAQLTAYLAARRMLIVLDNCEHLIEAAARLAERLLRYCPAVQLLATSREALGVPGEVVFAVPTLSLPASDAAPEGMLASEAVRLFVERATAQRPGFQLTAENAAAVAQICRRLDGIPLALELAAARVKVLSPAQIAARLDDRFGLLTGGARTALPRQQTLRALVDWSHDLLEPVERVLFRRLGVFAGSWTLGAAEVVTHLPDAPPTGDVVEQLSRLVDKSLVKATEGDGEMRYEMLETMRAYARERLVEAGELDALRARHLAYFTGWAERHAPELHGPQQAMWLNRVEREHDNLRLALRRALVDGDDLLAGARLTAALGQFWLRRNYPQEGRRWTRLALERLPADAPPAVEAPLRSGAGSMAWLSSDVSEAAIHHTRALELFRALGNMGQAAMALRNLAVQEQWLGRPEQATVMSAEAAEMARAAGDRLAYGACLLNLGLCHYYTPKGSPETRRVLEASVDVLREVGDEWPLAMALCALGMHTAREGDVAWAAAYMAEALQIVTELGDPRLEALTWQSWGKVQRIGGRPAEAVATFRRALGLFARTADLANTVETMEELAAAMTRAGAEPEQAAQLLGAARAWREQSQVVIEDDLPAVLAAAEPALRVALGEVAFNRALARGGGMPLNEAIDLAIG